VMDYWLSFVRSLDPNTYKEAGAPTWETVGSAESQSRLVFEGAGKAGMEKVPEVQKGRCAFWEGLAVTMEQ
jgi:acetylcholinesterase